MPRHRRTTHSAARFELAAGRARMYIIEIVLDRTQKILARGDVASFDAERLQRKQEAGEQI